MGKDFDLNAIVNADNESGVEQGEILLDLAEAVLSADETGQAAARQQVRQNLGDAALVDACATIASFNAVVKLADGCGIPLEDYKERNTRDIRAQLVLEKFS